jgi:hypothetical protein
MKIIVAILAIVLLVGCDDRRGPAYAPHVAVAADSSRFAVERVSVVLMATTSGGEGASEKHEIFIVTDTKTGIQYLGVESVGLCKLEESSPAVERK